MSETLLRANVREFRKSELSIMPEGLEEGLELRDMADLLAYLLAGAK